MSFPRFTVTLASNIKNNEENIPSPSTIRKAAATLKVLGYNTDNMGYDRAATGYISTSNGYLAPQFGTPAAYVRGVPVISFADLERAAKGKVVV